MSKQPKIKVVGNHVELHDTEPDVAMDGNSLKFEVKTNVYRVPLEKVIEAMDSPFGITRQASEIVYTSLKRLAVQIKRDVTVALIKRNIAEAHRAIDEFERNIEWSDHFTVNEMTPLIDVMTVMRPGKRERVVFEQTVTALEGLGVETFGDLLEYPLELLEVESSIGEGRMAVITRMINEYSPDSVKCSGCGAQFASTDGLCVCSKCLLKG